MVVKILGGGCPNCGKLEQNAKQAASNLKLDAEFEKVKEMKDIMAYGVMSTPALVVDDEVKVSGRIATVEEIENYLKG